MPTTPRLRISSLRGRGCQVGNDQSLRCRALDDMKTTDLNTIEGLQACNASLDKIWAQLRELWAKKNEDIWGGLWYVSNQRDRDEW